MPVRGCLAALAALVTLGPATAGASPFVNFESGPVRPVAIAADGETICVTNLPDGYLEIVDLTEDGLRHRRSVAVGVDPVAVAIREGEAWVVNHLSDSVSIVDVATGRVRRTLLVGDAPRDIVFAGDRVFVTTAHRGQRRTDAALAGVPGAGDPRFTEAGVGRADVWVFDANALGADAGGVPLEVVTLFGDTPRALAVSADASTVYAAVFHSGNQTTTLHEGLVCNGFDAAAPCEVGGAMLPGGNPGPAHNVDGVPAPEVGLIVQFDPQSQRWQDELGRDWSDAVRFSLPDYDVFAIDAQTLTGQGTPVQHVGTTLFNMAVNPVSGALYVSNTDAGNAVRFEGDGEHGGTTVQGDLARARITVIDGSGARPRHLNPHIDYGQRPAAPGTAALSLATPLDMAVSADGETLYLAAYGSARIGVLDVATLEQGALDPEQAAERYIETSGGGPAGLVLDEDRGRLYVYTRFDNGIAAVDLAAGVEIDKLALPTPEPESVRDGRATLYDARETSSNGEASCASCHVFGGTDHLAWDLGDPDAPLQTGEIPIRMPAAGGAGINGTGNQRDFHPMKGPMLTQTLRGLPHSGALHWRGDRSVGVLGDDPTDAVVSFNNFIVAFVGLLGRAEEIAEAQMEAFTTFAMTLTLPPNPVRPLDNALSERQQAAMDFYTSPTRISDGVPVANLGFNCNGCHALDPEAGHFGTRGEQAFSGGTQMLKVPHLRAMVERVGMFGMAEVPSINPGNNADAGPQIRGFGFSHDGSVDTLFRFFQSVFFNPTAPDVGFASDEERRDMESLVLAYASDIAPIVGQQITVDGPVDAVAHARAQMFLDAAERPFPSRVLGEQARECELVAKVAGAERTRGFVYREGAFIADDDSGSVALDALLAMADLGPVTLTAVTPGTGIRRGVDRDGDGRYDGVDPCPMDPINNTPQTCSDLHVPVDGLPMDPADDDDGDGDGDDAADDAGAGSGEDPMTPAGSNEDPGCASCRQSSASGRAASGRAMAWLAMLFIAVGRRRRPAA